MLIIIDNIKKNVKSLYFPKNLKNNKERLEALPKLS